MKTSLIFPRGMSSRSRCTCRPLSDDTSGGPASAWVLSSVLETKGGIMREAGSNRRWWKKAGSGLLAGLVVVGVVRSCTGTENESSLTAQDAHHLCNEAIKAAAPNAAQVEIPYKAARETVRVFSFIWRTGDGLKMPDQSGDQHDTAVVCRVGKEQNEVVHLEIDGETVLPRQH